MACNWTDTPKEKLTRDVVEFINIVYIVLTDSKKEQTR